MPAQNDEARDVSFKRNSKARSVEVRIGDRAPSNFKVEKLSILLEKIAVVHATRVLLAL